jgi:hypothetical protein
MKLAKLLDPATFNKLCNAVQLNPLTVSQPRVHQVAKGAMHLSLLSPAYGDDNRGYDIPKPYQSNMAACCHAVRATGNVPRMQKSKLTDKKFLKK